MGLNKQIGNMYPWVTHTWNVIKGKCPHDCSYCYMKRYPQPDLHFDERELTTNLGEGNIIFIGSSCDDWAVTIPLEWLDMIWQKCILYPKNLYLFQSKNPTRFMQYEKAVTVNAIWATTIESNRLYINISKAPSTYNRYRAMTELIGRKMVSIEPIMDFDLDDMVRWMHDIKPEFVSIGADSKGHNLPEPSSAKAQKLIEVLGGITTVKVKKNLCRILTK